MEPEPMALYKDRFENLLRVTKKVTSCLNIGDILEIIRDEVKFTIPLAKEACMILMDPDAPNYTRPLHCSVRPDQINCHPCERGKALIQMVLADPTAFQCPLDGPARLPIDLARTDPSIGGLALPIFYEKEPLAVLKVVTERGQLLQERDIVLLTDLVEVTANAINNAKKYSRMASEKLSLERILGHIRPFVPETVQRIVEKNPDAPALSRQELDVSILFLDVADYTRISESLTQDKVNFIIEKYFSSFLGVIYSHEGDVNETAGDGLMAIFQGTADLNAMNAARAALEIRRRTFEINEELEGRFYPIAVNMGINSGTASVGMSRFEGGSGTRTTFTASGPVTNLASRLAAAAGEGDILVGPETARRIQDMMMLFSRGPMSFKNIRENVLVHSLVPPTQ
jgi:class 3 adenylate cyclase